MSVVGKLLLDSTVIFRQEQRFLSCAKHLLQE